MAPLLSVIVPAYGVGEYLPACLDSLRAQTLRDLEIIVVDDGSPDECGEIADDFASRDPRMRVLHTENQGLGQARNTGTAEATGRYLVFADSDDLIPPRAYDLLVSSLESTGSDIAAGNTWRYVEGKGNVQSWTHKEAFAETRLATHIRQFPVLIRDRMVWNKVFRRSFWDAGGYAFPAIRYEDYPVTLAAHLDAAAVDVLSDKVYLWRERLAENSITQRSMELGNLRDRVTSAEMTLAVAEKEGGEILERLYGYFTDIDIITLATALREGVEADRTEIGRLAVSLARRLHPRAEWSTSLARQVLKSLQSEDLEGAAALTAWRRGGNKAELVRTFVQPRRLHRVPGLTSDIVLGGRPLPKVKDRRLRSRVMEVVRLDEGYLIQVEAKLRRLLLERATISVELASEERSIALESRISALVGQRATVEVNLPDKVLETLDEEPLQMVARVAVGPMEWVGAVAIPRNEIPEPAQLPNGDWGVVSHWAGSPQSLWVRKAPGQTFAVVDFTDGSLEVRVSPEINHVAILRPAPSPPLVGEVTAGIAEFALDDVIDDPADDPVTSRAYRDIVALSSEALERIRPGVAQTTRLVGEMTGAQGDSIDASPDADPMAEDLAQAVSDQADGTAPTGKNLEALLHRSGIMPLLLGSVPEDEVRHGEHAVRILRSPTSTAELSHQRLDHRPKR